MIYLASTSPRRKKILKKAGIVFKIIRPDYEENSALHTFPSHAVKEHALGKARSAAKKISKGTVIGCDTVVYFRKKIICKPKNMADAFRMLTELQGRRHFVYTGVAVLRVAKGRVARQSVFYEKTGVTLKKMKREDMADYFRKIKPLDKAGAYAIQSSEHGIVKRVEGSFWNAVGLPLERLRKQRLISGKMVT